MNVILQKYSIYLQTHLSILDSEGWDGEGGRRGNRDGEHMNSWLIHVNVWQKPLQYCKVISLQLIKINEKKNKTMNVVRLQVFFCIFLKKLYLEELSIINIYEL